MRLLHAAGAGEHRREEAGELHGIPVLQRTPTTSVSTHKHGLFDGWGVTGATEFTRSAQGAHWLGASGGLGCGVEAEGEREGVVSGDGASAGACRSGDGEADGGEKSRARGGRGSRRGGSSFD